MRLSGPSLNGLVNDFAARLQAGSLAIYAGDRPLVPGATTADPLVVIPLGSPAFPLAVDGLAVQASLPPAVIDRSGEASWAQLLTMHGEVVADVRVRSLSDPTATEADLVVDDTDFRRGGLVSLARLTLSLPPQS